MSSAAGDDAILRIHREQKIACENEFSASHINSAFQTRQTRNFRAESRMKSAARSPIMLTAAWVLQLGIIGMTEASATRRPSMPRTASNSSTTDKLSLPILAVPQV